jgi:hypothetical protein
VKRGGRSRVVKDGAPDDSPPATAPTTRPRTPVGPSPPKRAVCRSSSGRTGTSIPWRMRQLHADGVRRRVEADGHHRLVAPDGVEDRDRTGLASQRSTQPGRTPLRSARQADRFSASEPTPGNHDVARSQPDDAVAEARHLRQAGRSSTACRPHHHDPRTANRPWHRAEHAAAVPRTKAGPPTATALGSRRVGRLGEAAASNRPCTRERGRRPSGLSAISPAATSPGRDARRHPAPAALSPIPRTCCCRKGRAVTAARPSPFG